MGAVVSVTDWMNDPRRARLYQYALEDAEKERERVAARMAELSKRASQLDNDIAKCRRVLAEIRGESP